MGNFKRFFVGLLLTLATVSGLTAQTLQDHLGPLANYALQGKDAPWEARLEGGWYNLYNSTDPQALQLFYEDFPAINGGEREVQLNTALVSYGEDESFAGIAFDIRSGNDFKSFVIGSDGTVLWFRFTQNDLETHHADANIRPRLDGSDVLKIRETPGRVEMFLNGTLVMTIATDNGFQPSYGVLALRAGRFAYTGFAVDTRPGNGGSFPAPGGGNGQTPFPAPGGGNGQTPFPAPGGGNGGPGPAPAPAPGGQQAPGNAPQLSPEQALQVKAVLGTTLSIFLHEFAHALIGETSLPATGPEEDTADAFSAIMMAGAVAFGSPGAQPDTANNWSEQMSEYGVLFWYYSGLASQNAAPGGDDWQDEHAPDINRFRNAFCLMYGMSPQLYDDIADKVGFNERSRARCQADSAKQLNAWNKILETIQGDGTPRGRLIASFEPPQDSPAGEIIKYFMGDSGVLQIMLDTFSQSYNLPRNVPVRFRNCPEINAWYDPEEGSITLCYRLFDLTSETVIRGEGGQVASPRGGGNGGGSGGLSDAEVYLLGIWDAQYQVDGRTYTAAVGYDQDRSYVLQYGSPYGQISVVGNWAAEITGPATLSLLTEPVQWEPRQLCDGYGNCQANDMIVEQTSINVLDQNRVEVDGIIWQRRQ